jgi:hypothetical protein
MGAPDPVHLRLEPLEGLVELSVFAAVQGEALMVRATFTNRWGEAVYVFRETTPFVRIGERLAHLTSTMPIIPSGIMPLRPHVPKVVSIAHESRFAIDATYPLPLRNRHCYPAPGAREDPEIADEVLEGVTFTLGFFPVSDGNEITARGVPSYYGLRRQFLAVGAVRGLAIAAKVPR